MSSIPPDSYRFTVPSAAIWAAIMALAGMGWKAGCDAHDELLQTKERQGVQDARIKNIEDRLFHLETKDDVPMPSPNVKR